MLNDPGVWRDPEVFRPERFLEAAASEKPHPLNLLFGYGSRYVAAIAREKNICARKTCLCDFRVCPGMYFADRVVLHVVATIISLFHIAPLDGKKIPDPQSVEYTDLAIRYETASQYSTLSILISCFMTGTQSGSNVDLFREMKRPASFSRRSLLSIKWVRECSSSATTGLRSTAINRAIVIYRPGLLEPTKFSAILEKL